jgi:hypothetical protein
MNIEFLKIVLQLPEWSYILQDIWGQITIFAGILYIVHWTFPDIFTGKPLWFPSISPQKNPCVEVFHQERTAADRLETVGEYVADFCGLDGLDRCGSMGRFTEKPFAIP